jgi:hypothetical protein
MVIRLVALILLVARSTVGASLTVAWHPVASFVVYYGSSFGVYTAIYAYLARYTWNGSILDRGCGRHFF